MDIGHWTLDKKMAISSELHHEDELEEIAASIISSIEAYFMKSISR